MIRSRDLFIDFAEEIAQFDLHKNSSTDVSSQASKPQRERPQPQVAKVSSGQEEARAAVLKVSVSF